MYNVYTHCIAWRQDFGKLLKRLRESEGERIRFCLREATSAEEKKEQWVGKKLDLKVSEAPFC